MIGEMAALTAAALWAGASLIFTMLRAHLSASALNLWKNGLALFLLALTLLVTQGQVWPQGFASDELIWLALSGIIGLSIGDTLLFQAFTRLGPRRTLLMTALAPPFTAAMAWPALAEPITLGMTAGIVVTLLGVSWVVFERTAPASRKIDDTQRSESIPWVGYGLALGAALCQAIGNVATKLGGEHGPLEMSVIRLAFGAVALIIFIGLRQGFKGIWAPMKRGKLLFMVVFASIIGTYLGIWLQVTGLRYAPAGIASTLSSTSPIFVLPLAYFFLKERLSVAAIGGAAIAVAGIAILCLGA